MVAPSGGKSTCLQHAKPRDLNADPSASPVRNASLALTILIILYVLLQSPDVGTSRISSTARQQLRVISNYTPWPSKAPRITKITSLFGEKDNDLYENVIRSHEEHDRIHGYETRVFREKIVESYWSKPALLLSVLVAELEKPADERTEWLMWISPDVMILNTEIPLEIFLPPDDFKGGHVLVTRDQSAVNDGVFFLHVHSWSVRMLIDVLSIPKREFGDNAARKALDKILRSETCRESVFYQPRKWYNTYQTSASDTEAKAGDLLVHFHGLGGDKWGAMASTIAKTSELRRDWSLPLERTSYEKEIGDYWNRIREARALLAQAWEQREEPHVDPSYRRLQYATTYEVDDIDAIGSAMSGLREATGIR